MESLSVIVTAHNCAAVIERTLQSVADALARAPGVPAEVVIVDDGSTDDTPRRVAAFIETRPVWQMVRRPSKSSPSCARNTGVEGAAGSLLCFLDGDDLFLPQHLATCYQELQDPQTDYIKTGVRLPDPVHPDWQSRINFSVVINLCLRRPCHDRIRGFPDWHLFRRQGDGFAHESDLFYEVEDMYYNLAVSRLCRGRTIPAETVARCRFPGNSFDRQYEKFRRPFGEYPQSATADEQYRLRLADVIFQHHVEQLSPERVTPPAVQAPARPDPEALNRQGLSLAEQGRTAEAAALFRQAVAARPDHAAAHHNLGVALANLASPEEGAKSLEEALRLRPDYAEACYNLGNVLSTLNRKEDAIARYEQAIALRPGYGEAYNNLGLALTEARRPDGAIAVLEQGVRLRPQAADAHNNLGLAYAELGRFAEATACYREALRLKTDYADAHSNLANALKEEGRTDEALAYYQIALWHQPNAPSVRWNRALTWLQAGDYERGWSEYEWRWQRKQTPARPFRQPHWDGSSLEGRTILLYSEQGLGDTIQFVRYAPLVKDRGGRVIVECPGILLDLFKSCAGIDELVAELQPIPEFDVQAPLMSLPALFGTTLDSVPAQVPYVHADFDSLEKWRRRLRDDGSFRVGICWQGNPNHQWDRHRSIPLHRFAALADVPGVKLFSLQKWHGLEQLREPVGRPPITELPEAETFLDTAAVMTLLDLVITADTSVAHLAGALGLPVWVALAKIADWRWLFDREDSPWYPTMRLFRQPALGDWASVFERMASELRNRYRLCDQNGQGKSNLTVLAPAVIDRDCLQERRVHEVMGEQSRTVRPELLESVSWGRFLVTGGSQDETAQVEKT